MHDVNWGPFDDFEVKTFSAPRIFGLPQIFMFGHRTIENIRKKLLHHPEGEGAWAKSNEPIY